jgi:hypothetical protein
MESWHRIVVGYCQECSSSPRFFSRSFRHLIGIFRLFDIHLSGAEVLPLAKLGAQESDETCHFRWRDLLV